MAMTSTPTIACWRWLSHGGLEPRGDLADGLSARPPHLLFDDNQLSSTADSRAVSDDQIERSGPHWHTARFDGLTEAVALAIEKPRRPDRPALIACATIIGPWRAEK